METTRGLAAFLRARRELLKPADVGLPYSERRRVEGLRREEVAMLAGISTECYLRLEQGRDHQPSDQVLDGIARALQLDEDAGNYLRALARPAPRRRGRSVPERFDPAVQTLIDSWPLTPTFVVNRNMGILASNRMARALSHLSPRAKTSCAQRFSSPKCVCSTVTGTALRPGSSRSCEPCSERSHPIANSSSSSANSALPASDSLHCGRVTPSSIEATVRPPSTTRRSRPPSCAPRPSPGRLKARA